MTVRTIVVPIVVALAAGGASAQQAGSPEPLPEPYYRENLIGRYAVPGRCGSEEVKDLLVVTGVGIQIGDVLCEGMGKRTWEDGWMRVPLSTCRIDRREQSPRTLRLRRPSEGGIAVRSSLEQPALPAQRMERCQR